MCRMTDFLVTITKSGGAQVEGVKALGAPALISANSLARRVKKGEKGPDPSPERLAAFGMDRPYRAFKSFRIEAPDLDGMDIALDSAGFVAMGLYGGFCWTVEDYVDLASSRRWRWWAQMDCCCEPEVAGEPATVRLRQAKTLRLLTECERLADTYGIPRPMPVLQGWDVEDYVWHAQQLAGCRGYEIVGVGSMCRREVESGAGQDGMLAVVEALDDVLAPGVGLHLFGVKSEGLEALAGHHRVVSVDSNAWDFAARRKAKRRDKVKATAAYKIAYMAEWYERQVARIARAELWTPTSLRAPRPRVLDDLTTEWAELVAGGEIDMESAAIYLAYEQYAESNRERWDTGPEQLALPL